MEPLAGMKYFFQIALLAVASCASPTSLTTIDDWVREIEACSVIVTPSYSLYSPYDSERTHRFVELVEREREAVSALFEIGELRRTIIWLRPITEAGGLDAELGESLPLLTQPPDHILGLASEDVVVVRVPPVQRAHLGDGRFFVLVVSTDENERTLRHELVHVATRQIGINGRAWLHEGIAHMVESFELVDGQLTSSRAMPVLQIDGDLPQESGLMSWLLSWEQSSTFDGNNQLARLLGFFLVTFLVESRAEPFPEALRSIANLSSADLLDLEDEWISWLEEHIERCTLSPSTLAGDPVP
jgi:hypothetical protein